MSTRERGKILKISKNQTKDLDSWILSQPKGLRELWPLLNYQSKKAYYDQAQKKKPENQVLKPTTPPVIDHDHEKEKLNQKIRAVEWKKTSFSMVNYDLVQMAKKDELKFNKKNNSHITLYKLMEIMSEKRDYLDEQSGRLTLTISRREIIKTGGSITGGEKTNVGGPEYQTFINHLDSLWRMGYLVKYKIRRHKIKIVFKKSLWGTDKKWTKIPKLAYIRSQFKNNELFTPVFFHIVLDLCCASSNHYKPSKKSGKFNPNPLKNFIVKGKENITYFKNMIKRSLKYIMAITWPMATMTEIPKGFQVCFDPNSS